MVLVGMLFSCKECYCGNSGLIKKICRVLVCLFVKCFYDIID